MSGGKSPKIKGDRFERAVCMALEGARRTFWQPEGDMVRGDIEAPILGAGECKVRKGGFKRLYDWLEDRDFLVVKADRRTPLLILRLEDMVRILALIKEGPPSSEVVGDGTAEGLQGDNL